MMSRTARCFVFAGFAAVTSHGATAADLTTPPPGMYVGVGAGITMPEPDHGRIFGPRPGANLPRPETPTKFSWDNGPLVLGTVGWKSVTGLRPEFEVGWRTTGIDRVNGVEWSGKRETFSFMGNLLYDIPTGSTITPYVGGGVGAARQRFNNVIGPRTPATPAPIRYTGHDTNFQWQAIAGVSAPITDRLSAFIDYRFIQVNGNNVGSRAPGCACKRIASYDDASHNVIVGLRFTFQKPTPVAAPVAPPPPPPPPVVAAPSLPPPTPYKAVVFFDWDKSNLLPEAKQTVHEAAAYAKANDKTVIYVTGHTDTSGPDAYNVGLSQRRALAVKDELVRQGIPAGEITVAWKGESQPLIDTGDGVKEVRNRRVEILYE